MGPEDRQAVVMDLVRRLDLIPRLREQVNVDRDQPFEEVKEQLARACPAPICELLQLVGSNPRTLGFALAYLSRRHRGEPSLYVSRSAGTHVEQTQSGTELFHRCSAGMPYARCCASCLPMPSTAPCMYGLKSCLPPACPVALLCRWYELQVA
jgi:hypothetical protein